MIDPEAYFNLEDTVKAELGSLNPRCDIRVLPSGCRIYTFRSKNSQQREIFPEITPKVKVQSGDPDVTPRTDFSLPTFDDDLPPWTIR